MLLPSSSPFISLLLLAILASADSASDQTYEGIFTSNTDLQSVLYTEAELIKTLNLYIRAEEERLDKLRK